MFAPMHEMIRNAASSIAGRSRRGTVLLLVLGALALVLILSVVYAALGKGDRRTASAVVERLDAQESVEGIGNHILDTIALDVFSLVPEVAMEDALALLGENDAIMRRETVDMPYTDFFYVSVPSELFTGNDVHQTAVDAIRFRPYGSHSPEVTWDGTLVNSGSSISDLLGNYADIDPRVASDPFLASTRPVDLGYRSFDTDYNPFENQRDWLQISNFAPDGRFVNLFYLRDDADEGGFDAPSLNLTRDPDTDDPRLSLMDEDGEPTTDLPFPDMLGVGNGTADWNRPAHWTMYQRNLFRPINDPDFPAVMTNPGDEDYWAYQYADADGDGMLDSRWIELVDVSDASRPTALLGDSDYRFFAAIRAIDLSSLVNVTTATDFLNPPSTSNRLGEGAHEINLFKLLHQTEHHYAHGNGEPLGYQQAFSTGTGDANDYSFFGLQSAQQLGRKAYLRLTDGAIAGRVQRYGAVPGEQNAGAVLSDNLEDYTIFQTSEERAQYASAIGSVYPGTSGGGNDRTAPYGIDDLIELLTYHGINDDQNFSLLEKALTSDNTGGDTPLSFSILRSDVPTAQDAWPSQTLAYNTNTGMDALTAAKYARSAVDVRRMLTTVSGHRPLRSSILDAAEYANLTESTDRKLWLNGLLLDDGEYPNDADSNTIDEYRQEQYELVQNAFGVYMDMLAPNLNQEDWNRADQDRFDTTKTQYYGHMGPELAVRLAGHMALNFRDMADTPIIDLLGGTSGGPNGVPDVGNILNLDLNVPTTLTAYQRREDVPTAAVLRLSDGWTPAIGSSDLMDQMWEAGMRLDVEQLYQGDDYDPLDTNDLSNPEVIALNAAQNVSHDAMILYGVEPQPFLSEVVSLSVYTDAPRGAVDSNDAGADPNNEYINNLVGSDGDPLTPDEYDGLPNIDGEVNELNPDFLYQALLFQMFNPFDVPIVLDSYYVEYADSIYAFTDGAATSHVIQPRETVVFWYTNPGDPAEVDQRIKNVMPGTYFISESIIEDTVRRQLGSSVRAERFAKRFKGQSSGSDYDEVPGSQVEDMFFDIAGSQNDVNRSVTLWRDHASVLDPVLGRLTFSGNVLAGVDRATDQLVDRLRDVSKIKSKGGLVGSGSSRPALDRRLDLDPHDGPEGIFEVQDSLIGDIENRAGDPNWGFIGTSWTNYNFGNNQLTFALWGSVSRKTDTTQVTGKSAINYYQNNQPGTGMAGNYEVEGTPVGALPAQVFETAGRLPYAKSVFLSNSSRVAGDGNLLYPDELSLLTDIDSQNAFLHLESSFEGKPFIDDLKDGNRLLPAFRSIGVPVTDRTLITLSSNQALPDPIDPSLVPDFDTYDGSTYIQITMNQNEFRDILTRRQNLRVGDMLLPLAVGGYRTPLETAGPVGSTVASSPMGEYDMDPSVRLDQYEAQWTTLGEALAAAMGYSDAVGPETSRSLSGGVDDPFAELSFDKSTGVPQVKDEDYVLDRGHLRLDAFPAFLDLGDGTSATRNGEFDPETDIQRGLGIPMALRLFDIAQAGAELGYAAMGGIDRPMMGTINTNTAEPEVLRLSPALGTDVHRTAGVDAFDRLWWPEFIKNFGENDTPYQVNAFVTNSVPNGISPFADVGSTIAKYRDAARYARHNAGDPNGGFGAPPPMTEVADTVVGYADPNDEEFGLRVDRTVNSGVDVLRTQPGIGSMGELFAARNVDPANMNNEHSMDAFARDGRTEGVAFIDRRAPNTNANYGRGMYEPRDPLDFVRNGELSMEIATFGSHLHGDMIGASYAARILDPTNPPDPTNLQQVFPGYLNPSGTPYNELLPLMPDQVPDDYDEQLIQLNAVLNSMSVGSDYYAVWFLVHGYKEADTLDLGDDDPLTPSFKARYLMIVDRSNVTKKGDRPKVLAFVQVPAEVPSTTN